MEENYILLGQREENKNITYSRLKMKLKPLKPTLREKERYVAFEVKSESKITFDEVKRAIENRMKEFIGELGMAKAGLYFLNDWKDNKGILKINSGFVDEAKASMVLTKEINNKRIIVQSLAVSGIIDRLRSKHF